MSPTLERLLTEIEQLNRAERAQLAQRLQELDRESEAEWENRVIPQVLGAALRPDGTIDFKTLYAQGGMTGKDLHDLYPEAFDEDGHTRAELEAEDRD
jgi:hypothetical protein